MPNPKLETYKNKATGTVYDYTDAAAQAALADILDGTDIDSFSDVESALADKVDVVSGKGLSTNDYDNTAKAVVTTAQDNIIANTKLIKDTVGWTNKNKYLTTGGVRGVIQSDGTLDTSGAYATDYYTSPYVPVSKNQIISYGYKTGECFYRTAFYTSNKTFISRPFDSANNKLIEIPNNAAYMRISVEDSASASFTNLMCRDYDILDNTYEVGRNTTAFPRDEQILVGARNLFNAEPTTNGGIAVTVNSDGTINAIGTREAEGGTILYVPKKMLNKGKYRLWFLEGNNLPNDATITLYNVTTGSWVGMVSTPVGGDVTFEIEDNSTILAISMTPRYGAGVQLNCTNIKIMITPATDKEKTWTSPAMTNKDLTEKVQGIINAATNAADFAAFKTAIGNL